MRYLLLFCTLFVTTDCALGDEDFFVNKVVPILQARCINCHGPEEQQGDFSLETQALLEESGFVEAGDAKSSHLIDVITPVDGEAQMPKDADPLSAAEIAVLKRWIDGGASWPADFGITLPQVDDFDWWSYQPIVRPKTPPIDALDNTVIDAFVRRKLDENDLSMSPLADRRTLIRRLSFDLLGLPPTPEAVSRFENDRSPTAYEELVDRMLASPRYGERWARHWLDVAKYADTCGYDKDKLRPNAWPYRDYVIRSFNEDKPFARFVEEQIAGDVIFPGTQDGILGLGFIAAGPWDFIGHVEVSETKLDGKVARNLDRDDMVSNVLNSFCSLTIQCARCHNHKFDPITQEHYYGLQSVFAAVDRAERPFDLDPAVEDRRRTLEAELDQIKQATQKLEGEIAKSAGPRLSELNKEIAELSPKVGVRKDPAFGYHSAITANPDAEKWVQVALNAPVENPIITLHPCHDEYANIGPGFGFPVRFRVEVSPDLESDWRTVHDQSGSDLLSPGLEPLVVKNIAGAVQRVRVTTVKLAERKNDYILALAELRVMQGQENVARGSTVTAKDSIQAPVRWARENLTDGKWAQSADPSASERLAVAKRERAAILAEVETPDILKRRADLLNHQKAASEELAGLPVGRMVYAAATQFKTQGNFKATGGVPRKIHVLRRGNIDQPQDAAVPGVLPFRVADEYRMREGMDEAQRRRELAKWLTHPENPLLWRSIVNRVWQYHFGQGIVATPNDFGRMGAEPTHPELLDWLAAEFRDGGGSIKDLHRLIVTSRTYQQSSQHDADKSIVDAGNRWWWRMNRRRLEAEEIRDSILSVSGAMNYSMGGPGFYLFELEKTAHSPHYEYHKFDPADSKSHRRSVYRFIVRSQPDPWMTSLDCADSSQSTPRRNETLTALQALSLMNNRFNLTMAEIFAERLKRNEATLTDQIRQALQLATQRTPTEREIGMLVDYANKHGLANVCRSLFNLSEFVFVD